MEITYIEQLTEVLNKAIVSLREGKMSLDEGKALANLAGKTIKSAAVQIEYARARQEIPEIEFMTKPRPKGKVARGGKSNG